MLFMDNSQSYFDTLFNLYFLPWDKLFRDTKAVCSITEGLKRQGEGEENSMCQKVFKVMAQSLVLMNDLIKSSQICCRHCCCGVLKIFLIALLID